MAKSLEVPVNQGYLGKSGSGKTYLALHHLAKVKRLIIVDPTGQEQLAGAVDHVAMEKMELVDKVCRKTFRVVWRAPALTDSPEAMVAAVEYANRVAAAAEDCYLLWDEVDMYTPFNRLAPLAYKLVNAGRHRRVRLYWTSRRPARVARDLTANANRLAIFRTSEPGDLDWARKIDRDMAKALPELDRYEAVDWRDGPWSRKKSPFK